MITNDRYEHARRILDPETLMNEAKDKAGLSDYGDLSFIKPMTSLLDQVARVADFRPGGLEIYRDYTIRYLVNRLRAEDDFKKHPEILEEDVSDPIIVLGLPRTGTTKMQRMISAAPGLQKTSLWRLLNPAPFPGAKPGCPDPRIAAAGLSDPNADKPGDFQAGHAMLTDEPEEEMILFEFTFDLSVDGFCPHIPIFNYQDWLSGRSYLETYRYARKLLQYLQWQDGGKQNRPWVLKAVVHIAHMGDLLDTFPNATLMHCHRDPRSTIPSIAKLMAAYWETYVNPVDKKMVGEGFLKWGSTAIDLYLEARARLGLDSRILDVKYEHIRQDSLSVIKKVYKHAGLAWTAEAESQMLQWESRNEQGKHGQHTYSLEEFGLNEEMIDRSFSKYIDRFIDRRSS